MSKAGDGNGGRIGVNNPTAARTGDPNTGGATGLWSVNDILLANQRTQWPRYSKPLIEATGGIVTTISDPTSPTGASIVHTFTGTGTFAVTSAPPTATVQWLIVAGGGGGGDTSPGTGPGAGGGGAGGFRTGTAPVTATPYPIVVGGGGPASTNGSPSSAFSFTSTGGGRGAARSGTLSPASSGGSGGGAGNQFPAGGGAGNSPPTSPPQGNPGGNGNNNPPFGPGGGGGGAGGAGVPGSTPVIPTTGAGVGGAGVSSSFSGVFTTYAVGGTSNGPPTTNPAIGSGGHGLASGTSPSGRAGIVIVKYPLSFGV